MFASAIFYGLFVLTAGFKLINFSLIAHFLLLLVCLKRTLIALVFLTSCNYASVPYICTINTFYIVFAQCLHSINSSSVTTEMYPSFRNITIWSILHRIILLSFKFQNSLWKNLMFFLIFLRALLTFTFSSKFSESTEVFQISNWHC